MSSVSDQPSNLIDLVVRRTIRASAERLFAAWTMPEHFKIWWGPGPVVCSGIEIDLRVGGHYRIANQQPDGNIVWIFGEFVQVEPPTRLVFTWQLEGAPPTPERVTVRFEAHDEDTEIIIVHERIASDTIRQSHDESWRGCLDGLDAYLRSAAAPLR